MTESGGRLKQTKPFGIHGRVYDISIIPHFYLCRHCKKCQCLLPAASCQHVIEMSILHSETDGGSAGASGSRTHTERGIDGDVPPLSDMVDEVVELW
jgi:hypothetical protein